MKKIAKKAAKKAPHGLERAIADVKRVQKELEWSPATPEPLGLREDAKEFQKDAEKRNRLLAILRDPVFREAAEILRDELEPCGDLPIFFKPKVAAARFQQHAGMKYFTDGLKRLSKEPQKQIVPQGKRLTTELPRP